MKQAILIMAHKDIEHLERLIRYFEGKCDIFIHLDKHSSDKKDEYALAKQPGVKKVLRQISVHWASHSILRCQLLLIEEALKNSDCRYIHLLSGQDYPLKPLEDFLRFFDVENKEFIEGAHLPAPHWDGNTYKRIQYYFFTDWFRFTNDKEIKNTWNFADKQDKWGIRRRIPDQIKHLYGGSAWFSLTRTCSAKVIEYSRKHPSLLRRFRFTFAPDEIYIHTVARHIEFANKQFGNGNLRYIQWAKAGDNHPVDFTEKYFHELSSSGAFFARKFVTPNSDKILMMIDKYLLFKEKITSRDSGAWCTQTFTGHFFDSGLAYALGKLCKICDIRDAIDFGCGTGWYVNSLRKEKIAAVGYDGNPNTPELSSLLSELSDYPCEHADLTEILTVEKPYSMTMCLSVGEYIPQKYEEQIWQNLINSTNNYLIISWGTPDICEELVVNPHTENYIKEKGLSYGLEIDKLATFMLRKHCCLLRHKKAIIVFKKN